MQFTFDMHNNITLFNVQCCSDIIEDDSLRLHGIYMHTHNTIHKMPTKENISF